MKTNILALTLFAALLIFACVPEVEYRDIKEFAISNDAVKTNQKIELMYASATPDKEEVLSYFVHAVGIIEGTNDTVNVLTPYNRGAGSGDSKNIFKFYTLDSEEGKAYFEETFNKDQVEQKEMSTIQSISRVTYDKRFNYIAINNFPTVIGFIDK